MDDLRTFVPFFSPFLPLSCVLFTSRGGGPVTTGMCIAPALHVRDPVSCFITQATITLRSQSTEFRGVRMHGTAILRNTEECRVGEKSGKWKRQAFGRESGGSSKETVKTVRETKDAETTLPRLRPFPRPRPLSLAAAVLRRCSSAAHHAPPSLGHRLSSSHACRQRA